MRTVVLTSAEEVFGLRPHWDALHKSTGAPVSMSFPWLSTWWSIFGGRFGMRTLAGWDGNRLVGLFPCFLEQFSLLRVRATRLRFLGEYSILAEYHPLVEPAFEEEFAEAAAEFSLSSLRDGLCDLIDVHAFPHDLPFMRRWTETLRSRGLIMSIRDREVPRIRIDLPKTVPEYFVMLSPKERQHIRRKERLLRGAGVEYECVTEPGDQAAFQDYVRLSRSLWDSQESGSYFSVREGFTRFQEEVTGRLLSEGKARLYFLRQDGRRFAALHAFLMNGVFQAYLGGRDPHHPLSRWSPGLMLMAHAIQCAIEEGFAQFDFLTGNQPYKHSLGGTVHGWHGRVTAALRGPRGWKGILMILTHNLAMGAGRRLGGSRLVRLFDRISAASRNAGA